jgi:hypothetical protein
VGILSRRKGRTPLEETPAGPMAQRTVLASAMPLTGDRVSQAWQARVGDEEWQRQAWYYYDAVGELRFAYRWLASAISRAVLYAAETDPETGQITGPTEDARAQAAAASLLGGTESRPRIQMLMALQWQVGGEFFLLIRTAPGRPDRWYTLSSSSVRPSGNRWTFEDPLTGIWETITAPRDRLIRVWSAHPNKQTHADSATRSALPVLTEIEKTSQAIASRLDSRLAGNGLLFVPEEIDFPTQDGEAADASSLVQLMVDAATAAIQTPGMAAAQVPIIVQVPGEMIGNIQHVDLATAFDAALSQLREDAFTRLGRIVELPREIALGQTSEANHWTAWQIEESTYKIHAESFLTELAGSLTVEVYRGLLASMGVENPERFVLDWDISAVVSRPDDTENLRDLHDRRLISDDYMRSRSGIPDDAVPDDEELYMRRLESAVQIAPTLAAQAEIAQKLFGLTVAPEAAGVAAAPEQPALEPGGAADDNVRSLPSRQSSAPDPEEGLVAAAELVVFDALSRAGGRLLTHQYRGRFKATPRHELHTVIPCDDYRPLLEGSFQFTENVAHAFALSPVGLENALREYVENRLKYTYPHRRDVLRGYLRTVASQ